MTQTGQDGDIVVRINDPLVNIERQLNAACGIVTDGYQEGVLRDFWIRANRVEGQEGARESEDIVCEPNGTKCVGDRME